MGETIRKTGSEIRERWHQKMPRFFYWLVVIACGIGGTAFAINTAVPALGGTLDAWWTEWYGRILAGCVGVVAACKFTVAGGYRDVDPDGIIRGKPPVRGGAPDMSDVETQQPEQT